MPLTKQMPDSTLRKEGVLHRNNDSVVARARSLLESKQDESMKMEVDFSITSAPRKYQGQLLLDTYAPRSYADLASDDVSFRLFFKTFLVLLLCENCFEKSFG